MNMKPNEDKVNIPLVTPLNLIGDIMTCKDCQFLVDFSNMERIEFRCYEDNTAGIEKPKKNPSDTACWKFKLKPKSVETEPLTVPFTQETAERLVTRDKPPLDITKELKEISGDLKIDSESPNVGEGELKKIIEGKIKPNPELVAETVQASVGDAIEVHYKGLHRIEYMFKQPNNVGGAIVTGPDGITRYFSQNECYFVKRIPKPSVFSC